jgi:hypothetical protein
MDLYAELDKAGEFGSAVSRVAVAGISPERLFTAVRPEGA